MTVVPGRGKCYFSSKSSEQDHLLERDGHWGNSTEVRQSPWKWVGLGWQSKLVWVPSGAVIEAFFMLTNRELRLAFGRTGSDQWLLRSKRGTSLQWIQRAGVLDFHFTCPSPGTWPVRKQRQTPGSSSRASALCGGHQGAPDCEAGANERLSSLYLAHKRSLVAGFHQLPAISNSRTSLRPADRQGNKRGAELPKRRTKDGLHCWSCMGCSLGALLSFKKKIKERKEKSIWSLGYRGQNRIIILYEEDQGCWRADPKQTYV